MPQYRHEPKRKGSNVMTGSWCYDFTSANDSSAEAYSKNKFMKGGKIYKQVGKTWKLICTIK